MGLETRLREIFGEDVKFYKSERIRLGITQKQLGDFIGLNQARISDFELFIDFPLNFVCAARLKSYFNTRSD